MFCIRNLTELQAARKANRWHVRALKRMMASSNRTGRSEAAMSKRNPYQIDRYSETAASHGTLANAVSLIGCLLAMAVLCLGMLYLMWKASGE